MKIRADVLARLQEEGITAEAIELAMQRGCEEGHLVFDERDGCIVTHAEIESVTLWVRFREAEDDVEIVDAYYHRMMVV